jgi:multidrug transporter EmrE-like cation transporter
VISAGLILFKEKLDLLTASGFILTLAGIAILSFAVSRN